MKLRNLVRSLHSSIGLIMGLLFVIVSLTGSGIVFHSEIDRAINRSLYTVAVQQTSVPFEAILAPVQIVHPNLPIEYVTFPKQPDGTYLVMMTDKNGHRLETFVNPYTGKVLGERVYEYSFTGFLYTLHHELFLGKAGLIILIIVGIALLIMSISGVMLWSGWRKLRSGLTIRWNAPASLLNFDLHQTVGIMAQLLLGVSAITGVIIVALHLFPMILGEEQAVSSPPPTGDSISFQERSANALSQLLQTANDTMPGGRISAVSFDEKQPHKLIVTKHFPEQATGQLDLSNIEIDRYSGKVLFATKVLQPNPLYRVLLAIANLHFGTFAGLPSRILYVFVGIAPLILLITGIKMFAIRRWNRIKKIEPRTINLD